MRRISSSSGSPTLGTGSTTSSTASTSATLARTTLTMYSPSRLRALWSPGVSRKTYWRSPR